MHLLKCNQIVSKVKCANFAKRNHHKKRRTGFVSNSEAKDNRFFSPPDNALLLSVLPIWVLTHYKKNVCQIIALREWPRTVRTNVCWEFYVSMKKFDLSTGKHTMYPCLPGGPVAPWNWKKRTKDKKWKIKIIIIMKRQQQKEKSVQIKI